MLILHVGAFNYSSSYGWKLQESGTPGAHSKEMAANSKSLWEYFARGQQTNPFLD
jgi:hypothetical protein